MTINRIICPVCESTQTKVILKVPQSSKEFLSFLNIEQFYGDYFWSSYNTGLLNNFNFTISECQNCHFIFQSEILDEEGMGLLYNKWLDHDKLLVHYQNLGRSSHDLQLLNFIKKWFNDPAKINILDFGAGYGNFCGVAKEQGYNISAYDLSDEKNEFIDSLNITVLNNLDNHKNYFHFIHLNQVLEHLANPLQVLRQLRESLTNNGLIYVATPNCRTIKKNIKSTELNKELFEQLSPHQHINAFNNKTLKLIGKNAGYFTIFPFSLSDLFSRRNKFSFTELKFIYKYFFRTEFFFRTK